MLVATREGTITRIRKLLHPVLARITGQFLRDLLREFDQAKRLVGASPGRVALLDQAHRLHPGTEGTAGAGCGTTGSEVTPAEELLDRRLPLFALALRGGSFYSPPTLTDAETTALLSYINTAAA